MEKRKTTQPPKLATRFLAWYCRPELLEDLQGDLNEFFQRNLERKGAFIAKLIYILDVLKFMRGYTLRKPSLPRTSNMMLGSYFKTSTRVILRNKLFSGLNIAGFALSMSVGLLVIALVSDLYSYDDTLQNKDRIYRVNTTIQPTGKRSVDMASTSWKAGNLIRQEIPGVESITILRRGFGGDASIGDNRIPVGGFYADEQFFRVFSFPLLKGIAETALREPRSLVLTRTTAKKLFGTADPMGRFIKFDTVNYTVTGVMEDIPKLSHLQFEMLVSLSSIDATKSSSDGNYMDWSNVFSNYVYVLLSKNSRIGDFTTALARMNDRENRLLKDRKILLSPQSLKHIVIGKSLRNTTSPSFDYAVIFILCGLSLVILLSACFNYTNLSMARSLGRSREVGIRKVMGASKGQVAGQFISESVLISLFSLCVAFLIFLFIRKQFLAFAPQNADTFSLSLSPKLLIYFILLAIIVGIVSGFLPSLFYSKINAVQVLKKIDTLSVFRHISLRKALIVIQYTFSMIFIVMTIIGYDQYKNFVHFDLGFKTDGILNIDMQGNKDDVFVTELSTLPSVKGVSKSLLVSSLGSIYGTGIKYKDPLDSDEVDLNVVDEHYLPLHQYDFLAGENFTPKPQDTTETETIVNETLLRRFNIGHKNPEKALGEWVLINHKQLMIVGVLKDFHYGTLDRKIGPTAFRYSAEPGRFVNVKISGSNAQATLTSIETLWKRIDKVHPLQARFYDEQIEEAYRFFIVITKSIGFLALLAVCIASLGLFGMVVYTMEKRRKEVSIRKVLGASNGSLLLLLSKGFLYLLSIAALIALPLTWVFFDRVVLVAFAYHRPVHFSEVMMGLFITGGIALLMIGLQTMRIVRSNPAMVLKTE